MSANDFGIDRNMVGNKRYGSNTFLQSKIFRRVSGINGVNLCIKLLSIDWAMDYFFFNIEVLENWKFCHVVGDKIITFFEIFKEDKIARCAHHFLIGHVRDFCHFQNTNIQPKGSQAGDKTFSISALFRVAIYKVRKHGKAIRLLMHKSNKIDNTNLWQLTI